MNAAQRKQITGWITLLQPFTDLPQLDLPVTAEEVEGMRDEEQEKYDNMPESIQSGEKGSEQEERVDHLTTAFDKLTEAFEALSNARDAVTEAIEALGNAT